MVSPGALHVASDFLGLEGRQGVRPDGRLGSDLAASGCIDYRGFFF